MYAIEPAYYLSIFDCPCYALFKLTQEDFVANYYSTFTALANHVEGILATILLDCFISRLKGELQRDIIP